MKKSCGLRPAALSAEKARLSLEKLTRI